MPDSPFILDPFEPAYAELLREDRLEARAAEAGTRLAECRSCPRGCAVNRDAGEVGVCGIGDRAIVASAGPHHGEEDCLRGRRGSGTIFFARCNLACVFCQNWQISRRAAGDACDPPAIAALMLALERAGCHNINLVSPAHVVPQLVEAIALAAASGLQLPIVYNTNAYDAPESLLLLHGLVDIFMPDFKLWEPASARRLCGAEDYPGRARAALREMHRQVGVLRFAPDGVARRGVLVRHLVMPGMGDQTRAILRWLAAELSPDTYVNLLGQYHPAHRVGRPGPEGAPRHAEIDRLPSAKELAAAHRAARDAGIHRLDGRGC